MTLEATVAGIALVGFVVAAVALAYGISSWRLFVFGCIPAAVALGLAAWEINRSCDHPEDPTALEVLFLVPFLLSLTLYVGSAVAGVVEGLRSGKAEGYGKAFASLVVCPLTCILAGGLVFFAALGAALHCYES
jgi:hypothetical protein